ncbi:hypothetical protein LJC31_06355 [Synergistaceae bacterium OttesenSCG-928-I11]|nr:hypothetical protein [Synergistaceae bacterium OttesenSCG-928-I11]
MKNAFGKMSFLCSVLLFVLAMIVFVSPLPHKTDMALMVVWVFAPAVVGSIVYNRMEKKDRWDQTKNLP